MESRIADRMGHPAGRNVISAASSHPWEGGLGAAPIRRLATLAVMGSPQSLADAVASQAPWTKTAGIVAEDGVAELRPRRAACEAVHRMTVGTRGARGQRCRARCPTVVGPQDTRHECPLNAYVGVKRGNRVGFPRRRHGTSRESATTDDPRASSGDGGWSAPREGQIAHKFVPTLCCAVDAVKHG